jgi:hypothetical protein
MNELSAYELDQLPMRVLSGLAMGAAGSVINGVSFGALSHEAVFAATSIMVRGTMPTTGDFEGRSRMAKLDQATFMLGEFSMNILSVPGLARSMRGPGKGTTGGASLGRRASGGIIDAGGDVAKKAAKGGVYFLVDSAGVVRYVGKTTDFKRRAAYWKSHKTRGRYKFERAIETDDSVEQAIGEQMGINAHGGVGGGQIENKINAIDKRSQLFKELQ